MNNMDNCGCGPGSGSMLSNQSDNLMGGGFTPSNNMGNGMSNGVSMNVNDNSNIGNNIGNTGMNPVITSAANNSNNNGNNISMDLNSLLNLREQSENISSNNNILESIAKNNISELNKLNNSLGVEGEKKKVGQDVAIAAKETIALSKKHILLATVFTLALAWNDAIKYYIGMSIKLNKASPFYYLYYALIITLLTVVVHHLLI
jgi:hypothetical protein